MGNNQSVTEDSERAACDREEEWKRFLQRETSENTRLREELEHELYCRTNELESLKTEIERERDKKEQTEEIQKQLKSLKPGDSFEFPPDNIKFPSKYNVGLFGTTGIGKSALINSLKFAYKGKLDELTREQTSTDQFHGGNTVRRLDVQVTPHLTFIDNRGVGAEDLETINAGDEIISQLEGRAGFTNRVDWRNSEGAKGGKAEAKNRIYCTILVFDARNPTAVFSVLPKLVDQIFKWQGRFPIGVLTNVDEATPEELENMYIVTKSAGIVDTYEVANITKKRNKLSKDHQLALLRLMRLCIKQGDQIFKLREEIEREEAEKEKEMMAMTRERERIAREEAEKEKEMMAMTRERERIAREEEKAKKKQKWKWKKN